MPIPGVLAGALARSVKRAKVAILGRALPLVNNPLTIAEEYAMLDNITRGRLIAGFVRGIGAEYHAMGINPAYSQERFAEAHDLIVRAWTEPGPFSVCRQALPVQIREHLAAALPDAASAGVDSLAGLRQHDPLGGEDALHLLPDAEPDRDRGAVLPDVSRRGRQGRLSGLARPARLVEHHLRRRHRREGDARGASPHLEALVNVFLKMPTEMLLPPGYTDAASMKRVRAAKVTVAGKPTSIEDLVKTGVVIVGSPNTVREKLAEYQDLAGFNTSLTKTQFGTLPDDMARANMTAIAQEILPHFRDRLPQGASRQAAE